MSTAERETKEQEQEDKEFLFSETRTALSYARTMMAAERTLLSFSTAGLSLIAGGIGLIGATDTVLLDTTGKLLIPIGVSVWIRGLHKYFHTRRLLKKFGRFLEIQGLYIPGVFIGGESRVPLYGRNPGKSVPSQQT